MRPTIPVMTLVAAALAACCVLNPSATSARPRSPKAAAASLDVDYAIALAGLRIGTGRLSGTFERDTYQVDVSATLTGLVGAITGGQGSARSTGVIAGSALPNTFAIATRTANAGITVRMALARGNVVQTAITPPLVDMQDRVPVTAGNKRGVVDPASALVMPARAGTAVLDPGNCDRTLPLFDGATRFDVVLSYGETREVQKPGYAGPVLVCNARYRAIAGHRPDRPGVKFMEDNREISVWLAPVEGTRLLVPLRISVLTEIGTNIIEATRWTRGGQADPTTVAAAPALAQAGQPAE